MKGFQLIATGGALPGRTVTNEELSRTVDTSDAWITSRTGIRTRHWCTADESAATLAIAAAKQVLQRSGLAPADIACCVCATLSAPDATPSVACQVQAALGLPENRPALDVNAACSGFLYGTAVARGLLATLGGQYALVIGCEALSRLMDPADRSTCVLFGDGAGAAVFELTDTSVPFAITLGARGDAAIHAGGPSRAGSAPISMDGRAVFRFAVDALPKCLHTVLDETQLTYIRCSSTGEAITNCMGGHCDYVFARASACISYAESGDLKPVVALQEQRFTGILDCPTIGELGYDNVKVPLWRGVCAPKSCSDEAYAYYCDVFGKMALSEAWKTEYCDVYQAVPYALVGDAATEYMVNAQNEYLESLGR